jgi:hypothetical protein
MDYCRGLKFD